MTNGVTDKVEVEEALKALIFRYKPLSHLNEDTCDLIIAVGVKEANLTGSTRYFRDYIEHFYSFPSLINPPQS